MTADLSRVFALKKNCYGLYLTRRLWLCKCFLLETSVNEAEIPPACEKQPQRWNAMSNRVYLMLELPDGPPQAGVDRAALVALRRDDRAVVARVLSASHITELAQQIDSSFAGNSKALWALWNRLNAVKLDPQAKEAVDSLLELDASLGELREAVSRLARLGEPA
jgi:hypothetical protein